MSDGLQAMSSHFFLSWRSVTESYTENIGKMISDELQSPIHMTAIPKYMCSLCIKILFHIPSTNNDKLVLESKPFSWKSDLICNGDNSIPLTKSELYLNNNCRQMTCKSIHENASRCIHY